MKTAVKVFLIISLVGQAISIPWNIFDMIVSIPILISEIENIAQSQSLGLVLLIFGIIGQVVGVLYSIAGIIISSLTLKKLEHVTQKKDLLVYGILCLIFCWILPGILILCMKDEDLKENIKPTNL